MSSVRNRRRSRYRGLPLCLIAAAALIFIFWRIESERQLSTAEASPLATLVSSPEPIVSAEPTASAVATDVPSATPEPIAAPTASPVPTGLLGGKFADLFASDSAATFNDKSYISDSAVLLFGEFYDPSSYSKKVTYFVIDIYIRDIELLRTGCAYDDFNRSRIGYFDNICSSYSALAAINGDYYAFNNDGIVLRNGELYRKKLDGFNDVCVLFRNGEMAIYDTDKININELLALDPWQVWDFGPSLLDDDGNAKSSFSSDYSGILSRNPRTAIGYFEPGHYCFVVADGRQGSYSQGLSMSDLARLMQSLGCSIAYNLDGGQTSQMYWDDSTCNNPYHDGRATSDIIYIAASVPQS